MVFCHGSPRETRFKTVSATAMQISLTAGSCLNFSSCSDSHVLSWTLSMPLWACCLYLFSDCSLRHPDFNPCGQSLHLLTVQPCLWCFPEELLCGSVEATSLMCIHPPLTFTRITAITSFPLLPSPSLTRLGSFVLPSSKPLHTLPVY